MVYLPHAPGKGRYGRVVALAALLPLLTLSPGRGPAVGETANPSPAAAPSSETAGPPTETIPYSPEDARVFAWARKPLAAPDYGVFSSVAVPISGLEIQERWRRLIPDGSAKAALEPCAGLYARLGKCRPALLEMARQSGLDAAAPLSREALGRVNRGVNAFIAYGADAQIHGQPDHWASIDEVLARRRGDCEDYAIAKMWLLAALGMPLERIQFVVVYDTRRRLHHAVLVVHYDGGRHVLDNTTDRIIAPDLIRDYLPLYSLAAGRAYLHGFGMAHASGGADYPLKFVIGPSSAGPGNSRKEAL